VLPLVPARCRVVPMLTLALGLEPSNSSDIDA
jgi:hypothetical protein